VLLVVLDERFDVAMRAEAQPAPQETAGPSHTPGPWRVSSVHLKNDDFPTKHPHYEVSGENSMLWIAHVLCFSDAHQGTEYEANARLIASAPDLLAENTSLRARVAELEAQLPDVAKALGMASNGHNVDCPCYICEALERAERVLGEKS